MAQPRWLSPRAVFREWLARLGRDRAFAAGNRGSEIKAGCAAAVITPTGPMWLGGYASRTRPSEGTIHDLNAKALALQDTSGSRVVILTVDLIGLSRDRVRDIAVRATERFGLERSQLLLNFSHTHTGPFIPGVLDGAHGPDRARLALVEEYASGLPERMLDVIGAALADLAPAYLFHGRGSASFAFNRRVVTAERVTFGINPDGVVDRSVPVLLVARPDATPKAIVFGYACHNTTLTAEWRRFSGDYAGFAQREIEQRHRGALALFVMGCAGDANPHPRSKLRLARGHGRALAGAVDRVVAAPMQPLDGSLGSAFEELALPFAGVPSRQELEARRQDQDAARRQHALSLLDQYERNGNLPAAYPYAIQAVSLGGLVLLGLAGEPVADYALRLSREIGETTWVAGYCNDLGCYLPSARVAAEGGYEVLESSLYYGLPGPFPAAVEEMVVARAREMVRKMAAVSTRASGGCESQTSGAGGESLRAS